MANRGKGGVPQRVFGRIDAERLAKGLGWFSVGLGLAQVAAPGAVSRLAGVRPTGATGVLMRGAGVRELAHGAGILSRPRSAGWVWSRVGGDAMDLAMLGRVLASHDSHRGRAATATAAVLGITALDVVDAVALSRTSGTTADGKVQVTQTVTVNREPAEVYAFWRDFRNLPRFMAHLESVQVNDGQRSHWKTTGPAGKTVEWDAEITEDRPGEAIAWRSLPGATVENAGTVRFTPAPGGRGTEVRVDLAYRPPFGGLGSMAARLFGQEPGQQARDDLRRFKQVIETGEVVRSEGSPGGMNVGKLMKQRPAQPLKQDEAQSLSPRPAGMAAG